MDMEKAKNYYELAAMGGDVGVTGHDKSLEKIRVCFMHGDATKDDFEKALRTNQAAKDEMKSYQRDAAATDESFRRSFLTGIQY